MSVLREQTTGKAGAVLMSAYGKEPKIGERYGRLKVVSVGRPSKAGTPRYWCRCDCGNKKLVYGGDLRTGRVKSCGHEKKGIVPTEEFYGYECIETGETFASAADAAIAIGCPGEFWKIVFAASDNPCAPYAGFHPETGEPLHWRRIKMTREKPYRMGSYMRDQKNGRRNSSKIVLLNTNTLYTGLEKTAKMFGTSPKTLRQCLKGKAEYAGRDADGNKLYWMYYDEWRRLFGNGSEDTK